MPLGGNRGGNYTARCCPGSYRRRTGLRSGTAYSVALMVAAGVLPRGLINPITDRLRPCVRETAMKSWMMLSCGRVQHDRPRVAFRRNAAAAYSEAASGFA